jgi:Fic family protein
LTLAVVRDEERVDTRGETDMMTLRQLSSKLESIPLATSWLLEELGVARGRQDLHATQSPQRLKALREHAVIESAVSSNRMEGVEIDRKRVATVLFGKPRFRDRNEEEVRGYRNALRLIHERGARLPVVEETILRLHRLCRGTEWDAGKYKERAEPIIERFPDGRSRVRFQPASAKDSRPFLIETLSLWRECLRDRKVPPLVALAAMNLDFLCIHPFRDGNGRTSRLILLLQSYHLGYEVGRYVSLERIIEENKERYYETLHVSSAGWHKGRHDPWPYINHVLFILKTGYGELEQRLGRGREPKGAKTEQIIAAIARQTGDFRTADIQRACPGVGVDMIRKVLVGLRPGVECLRRGPNAPYRKTAKWNSVRSK